MNDVAVIEQADDGGRVQVRRPEPADRQGRDEQGRPQRRDALRLAVPARAERCRPRGRPQNVIGRGDDLGVASTRKGPGQGAPGG